MKYFNDVIITDIERIPSITSDPNYDPLPSKNENYSNGDPGTILESNAKQKNIGVKNFGMDFGLILGPSGILKSTYIDGSEETVRDGVEMEENWKERYNVIKEKERKIVRAIEREKERAVERAEEEERENGIENKNEREIRRRKDKKNESEKVKEKNKEKGKEREKVKNVEIDIDVDIENNEQKNREEERKKRIIVEMTTGRIMVSDIESFVEEQRAELIDRKSRLHDENGNRMFMQKWEKEMGEERERKIEKEREGERKWDREREREEEKERDREKKEGGKVVEEKKEEGRKEKKIKGMKNAGEEETKTETERISGPERVRDSPYSLPSISRVILITPSSSTNISSSSSSSSPPLPHTTSSSPSPSPSTPSSASSIYNSASLLHPPSSTIPPLIPPKQVAREIPPPYFDEIEQEKNFRQNFNDIFRQIIYETLENVKKEKNSQNN